MYSIAKSAPKRACSRSRYIPPACSARRGSKRASLGSQGKPRSTAGSSKRPAARAALALALTEQAPPRQSQRNTRPRPNTALYGRLRAVGPQNCMRPAQPVRLTANRRPPDSTATNAVSSAARRGSPAASCAIKRSSPAELGVATGRSWRRKSPNTESTMWALALPSMSRNPRSAQAAPSQRSGVRVGWITRGTSSNVTARLGRGPRTTNPGLGAPSTRKATSWKSPASPNRSAAGEPASQGWVTV